MGQYKMFSKTKAFQLIYDAVRGVWVAIVGKFKLSCANKKELIRAAIWAM